MKFFLIFIMMFLSFGMLAQDYQKVKFKVWGNCEMCKSKIEKAAKSVEGVKKASWNITNLQMIIKFDADLTSLAIIQKVIAETGYDNEGFRSEDEVYQNLHYCCKYERPKPF